MKKVIRGVYIALVGLIVFTGALLIAQGALRRGEAPAREEMPVCNFPQAQEESGRLAPDGPELPI